MNVVEGNVMWGTIKCEFRAVLESSLVCRASLKDTKSLTRLALFLYYYVNEPHKALFSPANLHFKL